MGNKRSFVIISGIIVAFLIGVLSANPVADAANPVVSLLTDAAFGLEAIKNAITGIESGGIPASTQTQIDSIETETGKIQMLKDDVANLDTELGITQTTIDDIAQLLQLPPVDNQADLSVVQTYNGLVFMGHSFEIAITNNGPDVASNVVFIDAFSDDPIGSSGWQGEVSNAFCIFTEGFEISPTLATCNIGDLAPGETKIFTLNADSHFPATNHVEVFSDTDDPIPGNNESEVIVS